MKIDELVSKLQENECIGKVVVYSNSIVLCDCSGEGILTIPKKATNWLEVEQHYPDISSIFGKRSREYISAQIDEYLQTPIKERFPEKKYRLRWIDDDEGKPNYLDYLNGAWEWNPNKRDAKIYTEKELQQLKIDNPRWDSAIDAMMEPVEGNNERN